MTEPLPAAAPFDPVRVLSSIVLAGVGFAQVLERAAETVKSVIPGADEVSITMQNGRPITVASSGSLALAVDESQYQAGYGPCLDAILLGHNIVVDDQTTDPRWPDYRGPAVEAGVRSSLSVPLPVDGDHVGAFNIYSRTPHAFGAEATRIAEELASYAAVVLNNASLYFDANARAEQMTEAMASRATIEQAKGTLMGGRRCSPDDAFQILVKLSQQSGRKLNVVAQALVDQAIDGPIPDTP